MRIVEIIEIYIYDDVANKTEIIKQYLTEAVSEITIKRVVQQ